MSMDVMVIQGFAINFFELLFFHSGMIVQQTFLFPKNWVQNSAKVWIYFGFTLIQCEKIYIHYPQLYIYNSF